MQIIVLILLVAAAAWVCARFGWTTNHNEGANIGDKYMKEHWGMEPNERGKEDDQCILFSCKTFKHHRKC